MKRINAFILFSTQNNVDISNCFHVCIFLQSALLYLIIFVTPMAVQQKNGNKKNNDDFKSEPKSKKNNGNNAERSLQWRRIASIVLGLLLVGLTVAMCSYCFTWQMDNSAVHKQSSFFSFLTDKTTLINNRGGRLGAWLSHQLMYKGFGLAAFFLLPIMAIWTWRLWSNKSKIRARKFWPYTAAALVVLSPLLSYFFSACQFNYGGNVGKYISESIATVAGSMGAGFILCGAALACCILLFNTQVNTLQAWWLQKYNAIQASRAEAAAIAAQQKAEQLQALKENEAYEKNESELYIHDSFAEKNEEQHEVQHSITQPSIEEEQPETSFIYTPQEEIAQQPSYPTPSTNEELEYASIDETTFAEGDHNDTQSIALDHTTSTSTTTTPDALDLEVVQHEEAPIAVADNHASVETLEPYDPSLDLSNYKFPTIDLLEDRGTETLSVSKEELEMHKNQIIQTLKNFGIAIAKISATVGPTVTLYEIVPAEGVRISKIRNLEDDIALSLAALGIRIIAPIPGKGTIGIEVPNIKKQIVSMRTLIASDKFVNSNFQLPIAIGKRIDNDNYVVDLATMPHLLMAGATGQGKSVGLNAILVSLLYKKHPSQLKFVLVDPKKVELSIYNVIEKHFLAKLPNEEESIITDTKKVVATLNSLCIEMDQRYDLLKDAGVRNIKEYNEKFIKRKLNPQKGHRYLPFIVLVVDEFADLIMTAGKEVELPIARLAQLARAIGIHLIIATQRPSVNVITGTIKANFPARIAFRVSAKVDSRTILDAGGAEQLVGKGDLLISNGSELTRVQCAFVDTPEVEAIINFIGNQQGYPGAYDLPEYVGPEGDMELTGSGKSISELDQMFEQCARLVVSSGSGSTSMLQRRFNLGFNRAGRIMDQLEACGIVGASINGKPRDVSVKTEMELEELLLRLPIKG